MKIHLILFLIVISAVFLLSSCSGNNAGTAISESAETVLSNTDTDEYVSEFEQYYITEDLVKIPLSYEGKEVYADNVWREVIDGCGYEDFPAKEDIAPAMEFAFELYFKDTTVHYADGREEPCTVQKLRFASGLHLDFDGDGENESVLIIETDSDDPEYKDCTIVFSDSQNGFRLEDGTAMESHYKTVFPRGLVYDSCSNLILDYDYSNNIFVWSDQAYAMSLYTYTDEFNYVWSCRSIAFDDVAVSCREEDFDENRHYSELLMEYILFETPARLIWNPEKRKYEGIGRDTITYEELIEKVPETKMLCEEIERIHNTKITSIKTDGGLNFFFYLDSGGCICAYVENGWLLSAVKRAFEDDDEYHGDYETKEEKFVAVYGDELFDFVDNDTVHGLFLTYAVPDRRAAE